MTPLRKALDKLRDAKQTKTGYVARCPAHDDRHASLSITEGDDGRVLMKCHAGCAFEAIVHAMGLQTRDMMPEHDRSHRPYQAAKNTESKATFADPDEAIKAYGHLGKRAGRWDYHDANGELVGVMIRWNRPDGSKTIRPVSLVNATWRMEAMPAPRPLYRLPELKDASIVLVVEGEKVVDAARSLGFIATTSAGGSQAADKTDWRPLAGKEVWALRDYDKPGEKYALDVARLATMAGAKVKLLDPVKVFGTKIAEGYDLADAVAACTSDDARVGLREQLNIVADNTESWQHSPPEAIKQPNHRPQKAAFQQELDVVCMKDVEPKDTEWLWAGRIPLGTCTLVVGRPGIGKSFFTCDLAARVSNGTPWPDGSPAPEGEVLIISAEDDIAAVIAPRLMACGADRRKVFVLRAVRVTESNKKERIVAFDLSNCELIREFLQTHPNIRVIIVDPIGSYVSAGVDTYRDNEVRAFLSPIALLANEYRLALLLVCHTRKGEVQFADDAILGSRAFSGLPRSTVHISLDKNNRNRRLVLPGKTNWTGIPAGLAYTIAGSPPRIEWEPVLLDGMHADDVLATQDHQSQRGPPPKARNAATDWLRTLLGNGPMLVKDIEDEATKAGITKSTLRRARDELGIKPRKQSYSGQWEWDYLTPKMSRMIKQDASVSRNLSILDKTEANAATNARVSAKMLRYSKPEHLRPTILNKLIGLTWYIPTK